MKRHYLTNIENNRMDLVEEAINNTGRSDIHIDPEPMPVDAVEYSTPIYEITRQAMVGRYFSIYAVGIRDCSDFWAEYRRLNETDRWRVYFELSRSE
jgi:hypothetical protein